MVRATSIALVVLAACTSGAPPGFSGGKNDRWTFPLVGPLEDTALVAPVSINGRGPYLFVIDPDSNLTILDETVVKKLDLPVQKGPRRLDETDTQHPRFYAEVASIEVGTLIALQHTVMIIGAGAFDTEGRRIHGVLGRDVLVDSVVFGFDRDHGLGYLTTVGAFTPPPGATKLPWSRLESRIVNAEVQPIPRRLVDAKIGEQTVHVHLDPGAAHSQLRESKWSGLEVKPAKNAVIDEVGVVRRTDSVAFAPSVTIGELAGKDIAFLPYADKRWAEQDIDGLLGLDFLRAYSVWMNWDSKAYFLAPRSPVSAKERIARWTDEVSVLARCANPGCVKVRIADPLAGKPAAEGTPHPGVVLIVEREELSGGVDLEILLEAKDRPTTPRVVVNLPGGASRAMQQLKGEFVGATLEVVDASPYPRACPQLGSACVDLLAR